MCTSWPVPASAPVSMARRARVKNKHTRRARRNNTDGLLWPALLSAPACAANVADCCSAFFCCLARACVALSALPSVPSVRPDLCSGASLRVFVALCLPGFFQSQSRLDSIKTRRETMGGSSGSSPSAPVPRANPGQPARPNPTRALALPARRPVSRSNTHTQRTLAQPTNANAHAPCLPTRLPARPGQKSLLPCPPSPVVAPSLARSLPPACPPATLRRRRNDDHLFLRSIPPFPLQTTPPVPPHPPHPHTSSFGPIPSPTSCTYPLRVVSRGNHPSPSTSHR